MVIIAASIPSLRPLLLHVKKQVSSRGDSYPMNTYGANRSRPTKGYMPYGEGRDGTMKSSNNKTSTVTNVSGVMSSKLQTGSESEENILPIQKTGDSGITKRTDVVVRYDEMNKKDLERGEVYQK